MYRLPKSFTTVTPLSKSIALILFILLPLIGFYLGTQYANLKYVEDEAVELPRTINKQETNSVSPTSSLKSYTDERLEGMEFTYDSSLWEVIPFTEGNEKIKEELDYGGPGLLLQDILADGKLIMRYTLPYGTGGWVTLVTADRLKRLQDNLIRVKNRDKDTYQYGLSSSIVLFTADPDSYNLLVAFCKAERENPGKQYPLLDDKGCTEIESSTAIGLINGPTLNYSVRFKNAVDFDQIINSWTNDSISSLFENEKYVVVRIAYEGSNPEMADGIVKQIVK